MRMNWMRKLVFALTLGVLSWPLPLQLQAQSGGSSELEGGGGTAGGEGGFGSGELSGPSTEYLQAQKEFREKFKGIVHVTHEIRVSNVIAQSQAGLALLVKKTLDPDPMMKYEIVGAKELLRPELRPEIAELLQNAGPSSVASRYTIRDLVSDAKMQSEFVSFHPIHWDEPFAVVEKNGIALASLGAVRVTPLCTEAADLDIQDQVETKEQEIYEAPAKSYVPTITKKATIGSAVVFGNGGIGIAITRNGKVETLSGRKLLDACIDLRLLMDRGIANDPFGSGPSETFVVVKDKRQSYPFAADVAAESQISSKPNVNPDFSIEERSIDDALLLVLTAYKQSKDEASKEAATLRLKQILRDQFDSLRAVRRAQIEDLRRQLDQLESDEKIKTDRRDDIIDERFQQLIQ
ncbi:MAG: hypothetical protein ACK56W_20385 [Pirellula sp.]|nr:hypothetical protein [Pirellula sp.]